MLPLPAAATPVSESSDSESTSSSTTHSPNRSPDRQTRGDEEPVNRNGEPRRGSAGGRRARGRASGDDGSGDGSGSGGRRREGRGKGGQSRRREAAEGSVGEQRAGERRGREGDSDLALHSRAPTGDQENHEDWLRSRDRDAGRPRGKRKDREDVHYDDGYENDRHRDSGCSSALIFHTIF